MPDGGKRGEVFDKSFIKGSFERARRTETVFEESPALLVGKIGIDPERVSSKIAAFDLNDTLVKTESLVKNENGCPSWELLNRNVVCTQMAFVLLF